jgi:phosphoribosylformylglycinamidine synthase
VIAKNNSPDDIADSAKKIASAIGESNIVMLPGGYCAEPDGSGKFIAAFLRHDRIADAISRLLEVRGGLMLGIGDGFHALLRLGLLPYGRYAEPGPGDPAITINASGRYVSFMANVMVRGNASPWLSFAREGEIYVMPAAHSHGRFHAGGECLATLRANGQIAGQYAGPDGRPAAGGRHNPFGSACAIEGITSPGGRVLGMMGHPERAAFGLPANICGAGEFGIFSSAAGYFK